MIKLSQYNRFANQHSREFESFAERLLKGAAERLSDRPFDKLTVYTELETLEIEFNVNVELKGLLPWKKRIEEKEKFKESVPQYERISGWHLVTLTEPTYRENWLNGGCTETSYRRLLFLEPGGVVRCVSVSLHEYYDPSPRYSTSHYRHEGEVTDDDLMPTNIEHLRSPDLHGFDKDRATIKSIGLIGLDMPCPEDIARDVPGGRDRSFIRQPSVLPLPMMHHSIEYIVERRIGRMKPLSLTFTKFGSDNLIS